MKSLKLLSDRKKINIDKFELLDNGFLKNDFDFSKYYDLNAIYPTMKSNTTNVKSLPTIAYDKRFSNKLNLKQLIPKTSIGENLYSEETFNSFQKS